MHLVMQTLSEKSFLTAVHHYTQLDKNKVWQSTLLQQKQSLTNGQTMDKVIPM